MGKAVKIAGVPAEEDQDVRGISRVQVVRRRVTWSVIGVLAMSVQSG